MVERFVTKNKCTISDCSFINNNASNDGGAILLEKQTTVSNCKFIDNSAGKLSGATVGFLVKIASYQIVLL